MATPVVIELNDAGIVLARDGLEIAREPGFAMLEGKELVIGEAAAARARVAPQFVSHRYWDTLDQDTLPSEGTWRRTPAEVAFEQLSLLWARVGDAKASAIILVPATFTRAQLGLILGMCRKAGIPVVSLVDSALATLNEAPDSRQVVVVDLTLHRVTGARFSVDGRIRRRAVDEIDQFGLLDYHRRFAAAIGDICVRSTRYDPMHSATSEQALYDALPGVLAGLREAATTPWLVDAGGNPLEISVGRSELASAVSSLNARVDKLIDGLVDPALGVPRIVVTHRFDFGPEVVGSLGTAHGGVALLAVNAAVDGIAADMDSFIQAQDRLGLLTERALAGVRVAPAADTATAPRREQASHILVDNRIFRIDAMPFVVGTATTPDQWGYRASGNVKGVSRRHCEIFRDGGRVVLRDVSSFGSWVNGRRVDGDIVLGAGDVVRMGNPGVELRIVREDRVDGQA